MTAQAFAEVVGTPYKTWLGPVGAPAPAIDAADSTIDPSWLVMGTNGVNNQGTDGVTIGINETIAEYTPAGGTLPVKAWRTDEKITVAFSLDDMTVEQVSAIMDDAAVTSVNAATGRAGQKSMSLIRGVQVRYYAVLVRGLSPNDDGTGLTAQWEFSRVYQSGSQSIKYLKGSPANVAAEFTICGNVGAIDPATYRAQNAPHT